jgi:U6 snRNA-associated Sm-like protein LSm1
VPPTEGDGNARGLYADIPLGIFLVRGENVLLLGEIDLDRDDDPPPGYDQADPELVKRLDKERRNEAKTKHKTRVSHLSKIGFEGENMGEVLF